MTELSEFASREATFSVHRTRTLKLEAEVQDTSPLKCYEGGEHLITSL